MGYYLGYRQLTYDHPEIEHKEYNYVSESIIDSQGESYFFIKINDYNNLIQDYTTFSSDGIKYSIYQDTKKYFAKILLNGPKMSTIFDTGANFLYKTYNMRQPENISKLNIQLFDSAGYIIDLLQFNYSLTLEIKYVISSGVKQAIENAPTDIMNTDVESCESNNITYFDEQTKQRKPKNKYGFNYIQ